MVKLKRPTTKELIKDSIYTIITISIALALVFILDSGISSWLSYFIGA